MDADEGPFSAAATMSLEKRGESNARARYGSRELFFPL